jgi:hypothetical protein
MPGLTPENLQQIATARLQSKKIRRAISVATTDGWLTAIFACLTLLGGLFSLTGVVLGLGMSAIAFTSFRNVAALRKLDLHAPRRLGMNQLFFAGLIIAYSLWSLFTNLTHPSELSQTMGSSPELANVLHSYDIEGLTRMIFFALYGTLIAVAILAQGGAALYYFTRTKYLRNYLQHTPTWIIEMQRAGFSL